MKDIRTRLVIIFLLIAAVVAACTSPETSEPPVEPVQEVQETQEEVTEATEPEPEAEPAVEEVAEEEIVEEEVVEAEPVELHVAWWGSQIRHDQTIAVIEMFMEQYPHINVTYEFSGWGDYWTALATKAVGGELPDVMQQDYGVFTQYVADGLIIPLDPFADDGTIDMTNVDPELNRGGMVDGKLYAVNLGTNSQSVAIDLDRFEEAGIPIPEPDWTWQDFEEIALEIHDKLGILSAAPSNVGAAWNNLYLSLGQGFYAEDGTGLGFTDDQPLIDLYHMWLRLQDAGAILSREQEVSGGYTLEDNPFTRDEAAMIALHTNQLTGLWTAAGEDRNIKLLPIPRAVGATQSGVFFKPSQFFSITAHSEHPKEAAMLIDFFTNSVEANEILLAERGIPISSAVQEGILSLLPPAQIEVINFLSTLETSPIPPPDPVKARELSANVFGPLVMDPILFRQVTPEDGIAIMREEATALLSAP